MVKSLPDKINIINTILNKTFPHLLRPIRVLCLVHFERPVCPKASDAISVRTNQFLHFAMHHEIVIHHFLKRVTVGLTKRANGLATKRLHVGQKMSAIFVAFLDKRLSANETRLWW